MMKCFRRQSGGVLTSYIGIGEATAFLLLFLPTVVYAVVSTQESSEFSAWWGHYSQGWPLVYLERQVDNADKGAWRLWSGVMRFSPLMLAGNIAVAAVVALAVAYLWHLHTAQHPWWQFSLKEVLCLITVSAVGLSYCCWPVLQQRREDALAAQLEKMGWVLYGNEPAEPNWIMRPLVDLGVVSRGSFWRVRAVAWKGRSSDWAVDTPTDDNTPEDAIDALLDETARLLTRMKHCDEIHICSSGLTDQGIRSLCTNWNGCRYADLSNSSRLTDVGLHQVVDNWTSLEELDLSGTAVSDQGILELARLPRLSRVSLVGMRRISIDGAAKLIQHCGALKCVEVSANWLHEESFHLFRQLAEKRGIDVIAISRTK